MGAEAPRQRYRLAMLVGRRRACERPAGPTLRLTSILLNPPRAGGGAVTRRSLAVACEVLGAKELEIVNLVGTPTRDLLGLNVVAGEARPWTSARPALRSAVCGADILLFGWGLGGFRQPVRGLFRMQVAWLIEAALCAGHDAAWMLDGSPRHPSRWPQYLGPARGLYVDSTFERRVASALRVTRLVKVAERTT